MFKIPTFTAEEAKLINTLCRTAIDSEVTPEKAIDAVLEMDYTRQKFAISEKSQRICAAIEAKLGLVFSEYC